MHMTHRETMEW